MPSAFVCLKIEVQIFLRQFSQEPCNLIGSYTCSKSVLMHGSEKWRLWEFSKGAGIKYERDLGRREIEIFVKIFSGVLNF